MKQPRDPRERLEDICQAARKALEFVQGMSYGHFLGDDKTVYAVVRALEVVGEAAKGVHQDVRERHPEVPWRSMAGIRDKLIHLVGQHMIKMVRIIIDLLKAGCHRWDPG